MTKIGKITHPILSKKKKNDQDVCSFRAAGKGGRATPPGLQVPSSPSRLHLSRHKILSDILMPGSLTRHTKARGDIKD